MSNKNMIRMGNHYRLDVTGTPDVVQTVESGVYVVRVTSDSVNLQLKQLAFKQPPEVLGKAKKIADIIASDFFSNPKKPLGAIFDGVKGSGKSMTAEIIANKAIEAGLPVVVIDHDYTSTLLQLLVSKIGPCVLLFDEFEKYYSKSSQKKLLSFFSDQANEGVLSIIITNDKSKVTNYYIDRPGRFKYRVDFQNLDDNEMKSVLTSWGITGRMHAFFAVTYEKRLSYDTLLTLKSFMVEATSPVDYIEKVELLNVPKPMIRMLDMKVALYLRKDGKAPSLLRFKYRFDSDLYLQIEVTGNGPDYKYTFERVDLYNPDEQHLEYLENDDFLISFRRDSVVYEVGRVYGDSCNVKKVPKAEEDVKSSTEEEVVGGSKETALLEGASSVINRVNNWRETLVRMSECHENSLVADLVGKLPAGTLSTILTHSDHSSTSSQGCDEQAEG